MIFIYEDKFAKKLIRSLYMSGGLQDKVNIYFDLENNNFYCIYLKTKIESNTYGNLLKKLTRYYYYNQVPYDKTTKRLRK